MLFWLFGLGGLRVCLVFGDDVLGCLWLELLGVF